MRGLDSTLFIVIGSLSFFIACLGGGYDCTINNECPCYSEEQKLARNLEGFWRADTSTAVIPENVTDSIFENLIIALDIDSFCNPSQFDATGTHVDKIFKTYQGAKWNIVTTTPPYEIQLLKVAPVVRFQMLIIGIDTALIYWDASNMLSNEDVPFGTYSIQFTR